jgi:hypothetical protein
VVRLKTLTLIDRLFGHTTELLRVNMSSSQAPSSATSKRPATARMHAVPDSPRKRQRIDDPQRPLPTALDQAPPGTVKANIGECAPFNDHSAWVDDTFNNVFYVFGGTRYEDKDCIPTSDFFKCDARTMEWENMTVSFLTGEWDI